MLTFMSKKNTGSSRLLMSVFLHSTALIMFITAAAKMWSAFGGMKVLSAQDPLTGLSFGYLMLAAGIVELAVTVFCVFSKSIKLRLLAIAWLATNFVVYRIGLWALGWRKPCNCLGNFTDALHISPQTADMAMKIVLAYLLIGSYASLFWLWRQRRKQQAVGSN